MAEKRSLWTRWLNGIPEAAAYAHLRQSDMRRLVKSGAVLSRMKPKDASGKRSRTVLVDALSIDELILAQPSGANDVAMALRSLES